MIMSIYLWTVGRSCTSTAGLGNGNRDHMDPRAQPRGRSVLPETFPKNAAHPGMEASCVIRRNHAHPLASPLHFEESGFAASDPSFT